jgi:hypothetical protein
MRLALAAFFMAPLICAAASECRVASGPQTAALVELYTSEGCSSCPPADRWLSGFAGSRADARVVPLAFHVHYWDYIGWKDTFGEARYTERQRAEVAAGGARFVYTPQVIVGGRDAPEWGSERTFAKALDAIHARPARASLELESRTAADGTISGAVAATLKAGVRPEHLALAVVATQNGLSSRVTAGENRGENLAHDFVVRDIASVPVTNSASRLAFEFKARPGWNTQKMSVTAFLQDIKNGEVLQALRLACNNPAK